MPDPISLADLENAATDAVALGNIVNGAANFGGDGMVSTRTGGDVPTIAKVITDLQATLPAATYALEQELLEDFTPTNGTLAYAIDTDTFWVRNEGLTLGWEHTEDTRSQQIARALTNLNIWPDPFFEQVRSTTAIVGGKNAIINNSGIFVTGDADPLAKNPISRGAWKVTTGLLAFNVRFDIAGTSEMGIAPGDELSFGAVANGPAGSVLRVFMRYMDSGNNFLTGQVQSNTVISTEEAAVLKIEAKEVPANAVAALVYFDGDVGDIYVQALWAVPGAYAGSYPPFRSAFDFAAETTGSALTPNPRALALAPRLFALAGLQANVYPQNLRAGRGPSLFDFVVAGSAGQQLNERWTWTPVDADAGDYAFTLNLLDVETILPLASASSTLHVVAQGTAGGATKKLLPIGDSNTASGERLQRLLDLSAARPTDVQIDLVGTLGSGALQHEGRPGWSVQRYYAPTGADVAANPFVSGSGQKFNAAYYLSNTGQPMPDAVEWALGVNDEFSFADDATLSAAITTYLSQLSQMIGVELAGDVTSWKEVDASIIHLIALPLLPLDQDGFALVVGSGQTQARYWRNIVALSHRLIAAFGGREAEGLFLVPHNASHDVAHNMPKAAAAPWNVHTAVTVERDSNDVHPYGAGGNRQLADCEFAMLNWLAAESYF